nr:reverse transcriptase domain-containing protein [Tanacetum cinerariifolium]
MYTRGRKKADAEPVPPYRDPRDVETIEMLQQRIQELELQQLRPDSPAEEAKAEPNVWDDDMGLKIEIPEFTGKVHPDDFIDWLSTVERVFDVRDIPKKLKVKLVAIKLRQHASLWWDHLTKRRRIEGKSKVETWEKIKKLMKAKFLPENHRQEAFLDYHNLSQQNMIVEEVINEFDKLRMRCDVVEEEEEVVARFLGVLNPEIADICSRLGHYARDCPNLKTLAFVPDDACPIYDTVAEPELDEPGDELVYPNHGEALVIQRVLNTQAKGSNLFMKKTGFEGLMKTNPYVFTLVVVEENEIISKVPLQVQPLLREFADVIPGNIPLRLSAMRNIQHCIDFILGFAIPNRPAYRMNPKEFAKLQRQVTELLEKGSIRESMSPCAVPALLVPNMGGRFTWTSETAKAFNILKAKVTEAPVLALPNFDEVFLVECDASGVGIGGLLSQNQRPIAFFSEKLNDTRRKYSTYDKDFYDIVRSLDTWRHYLLSNEIVMFSDHEALKFINGQHKLKPRQAKWVEFIQAFLFVIRHKVGSNNQVADALSRRHSLITTMQIRVQAFSNSIFSLCYLFRNPFSSTTMGDENHIRTLGDYAKPSYEGYRNTIELPVWNNVNSVGHMDLRAQQSNDGLSEHETASLRNFYQSAHSSRRDHYTTSAGVNIIGGVITSASSDQTSNTIATLYSAKCLSTGKGGVTTWVQRRQMACLMDSADELSVIPDAFKTPHRL